VSTRRWRPRAAALLAGGAFALHQLRYLLAYGSGSHHELAAQGHAYLTAVAPLVAVVLLLVAADVLTRITGARPGGPGEAPPSLRRLWAVAAGFLFSAYCFQESLEGLFASGHPGGVAGVLGHGGWVAGPLAIVIGFVVALALRAADRAIALAAEPPLRVARPRPPLSLASFIPSRRGWRRPAVRRLRARAPPIASIR
jgi:hypothetical protein